MTGNGVSLVTLGVADLARSSLLPGAGLAALFGRQRAGGISQGPQPSPRPLRTQRPRRGCAGGRSPDRLRGYHPGLQLRLAGRGGPSVLRSYGGRRAGDQDAAGSVLGWLLRICRRPGWTPLGNCLQPVLAVRRAGQPGLALRALRMEKRPARRGVFFGGGQPSFGWRDGARGVVGAGRPAWATCCPASALSSGSLSKSRKPLWA
ncbi:hypothetical protein PA7077_05609 [Pseudomonas aeruginosa]